MKMSNAMYLLSLYLDDMLTGEQGISIKYSCHICTTKTAKTFTLHDNNFLTICFWWFWGLNYSAGVVYNHTFTTSTDLMSDHPYQDASPLESINVLVLNGRILTRDPYPHFTHGKPDSLQISDIFWRGIVQALKVISQEINEKRILLRGMLLVGLIMNVTTIGFMKGMDTQKKVWIIGLCLFLWIGPIFTLNSNLHRILNKRVDAAIPSIVEGYKVELRVQSNSLGPISYLNFKSMSTLGSTTTIV